MSGLGRFGRTPWPAPMHSAANHGLIGELVGAINPHTEADPNALTLSLLTAAGSALGRDVGAQAEGDRHGPNLYLAIVGESSKSRKGTTQGRAREVIERAEPAFAKRITGGLSSGEGLVWQVRDPILKRRKPRTAAEREQTDADGYVTDLEDEGIEDKRLLIFEGELAQTLRVMRRESNTLSAVLRNLWDRGDVASLTKGSPATTTGAHVSLIGHITADELRRELTATDSSNGFANRFVWCCARRSKILPDGGALNPADLRRPCNDLAMAITAAKVGGVLERDGEARDLWHAVYESLSDGRSGLLGDVTSRGEAQVLRLSVIYAALDCAPRVKVQHLQAALAVWDYCERSAAYIFGDALGDSVADRIREALASEEDGLSRTAIRDLFNKHQPADRIDAALSLLSDRGVAVSEQIPTAGRPAVRWRLADGDGEIVERPDWTRHLQDCDQSDISALSPRAVIAANRAACEGEAERAHAALTPNGNGNGHTCNCDRPIDDDGRCAKCGHRMPGTLEPTS